MGAALAALGVTSPAYAQAPAVVCEPDFGITSAAQHRVTRDFNITWGGSLSCTGTVAITLSGHPKLYEHYPFDVWADAGNTIGVNTIAEWQYSTGLPGGLYTTEYDIELLGPPNLVWASQAAPCQGVGTNLLQCNLLRSQPLGGVVELTAPGGTATDLIEGYFAE